MGQEAKCEAMIAGQKATGRAHLESDKLMFRGGDVRLDLPISDVSTAEAKGGKLIVRAKRKTYEFALGAAAARWAEKITNPPSLVQKLGIKPGDSVVYTGTVDKALSAELEKAKAKLSTRRVGEDHDWVFVGAEVVTDLKLLDKIDALIKPNGGIWVVFPKGLPDLKAETVISVAKERGLVDTKIARISDRLTAMKIVIPVSRRP